MKNFVYIILITFMASVAMAVSYAPQGFDAVRSPDRSKTWTFPSVTGTLSCIACTETLTNKTLTSPTINSGTLVTPTIDLGIFDGQGSTPSNPSAGFFKLYFKDSDGKPYYLNSGGTEVEVGSGGGGGASGQLLDNGDFDASTSNWTASGGTYASASGGNIWLVDSATWDSGSASQTLCSDAVTAPAGNMEIGMRIMVPSGTATHLFYVVDGSSNVYASTTVSSSTSWIPHSLNFALTASTSVQLCLESVASDEPLIAIDDAFLGPARNIGTVAQATHFGSIKYPATASCQWARTGGGSDSFGSFSADTDCGAASVSGLATAPGTKIPGLVFASIPPGRLVCTAAGGFYKSGAQDNTIHFRFSDGTNTTAEVNVYAGTGVNVSPVILGEFNYTTAQSNVTIQLQGKTLNTSNAVNVIAAANDLEISCKHFPSASEQVFRPNQTADVLGMVFFTGSSTCPTGSLAADNSAVSRTTYAQLFNRIGTTFGTGDGSTTFNLPDTRGIFVRGSGTSAKLTNANGSAFAATLGTYQNDKMQGHRHNRNTSGVGEYAPVDSGAFSYNPTGAGQLAASQTTTGNPVTDSSNGTPRTGTETNPANVALLGCIYHVSVPAPPLVGSVTSNSSGMERIERAKINCDGSAAITSQSGSWLTAIGNNSSGGCALTIASGIFSATPSCQVTIEGNGSGVFGEITSTSATSVTPYCQFWNGSTIADCTGGYDAQIICMGPR